MKIEYYNQQCYLSTDFASRHTGLATFFKETFKAFHSELMHLHEVIYPGQHENVFNNIERSWVGIFDNSVKRAYGDRAATIEEFSVTLGEKYYGRADYFVRLPNEQTDLLFEAKHYEETGGNNYKGMDNWYSSIIKQAGMYYNADVQNYHYEEHAYLVALIFGWIRKGNALKNAKSEMEHLFDGKMPKDKADFAALFFLGDHGVWVYGKVEKAGKKN